MERSIFAMIVIKTIDITSILQPGNIIAWLLVGLLAGYFANLLVRGRSAGCLGNIVIGLIGSVIGAILASALEITTFPLQFCGTAIVSFIGAAILLAVVQLFTGGRS
jgi:uncharacterized membrane protein YeaQ/YmgE (transglycosylase-associated protein family)